jgi:hypothetical protein
MRTRFLDCSVTLSAVERYQPGHAPMEPQKAISIPQAFGTRGRPLHVWLEAGARHAWHYHCLDRSHTWGS